MTGVAKANPDPAMVQMRTSDFGARVKSLPIGDVDATESFSSQLLTRCNPGAPQYVVIGHARSPIFKGRGYDAFSSAYVIIDPPSAATQVRRLLSPGRRACQLDLFKGMLRPLVTPLIPRDAGVHLMRGDDSMAGRGGVDLQFRVTVHRKGFQRARVMYMDTVCSLYNSVAYVGHFFSVGARFPLAKGKAIMHALRSRARGQGPAVHSDPRVIVLPDPVFQPIDNPAAVLQLRILPVGATLPTGDTSQIPEPPPNECIKVSYDSSFPPHLVYTTVPLGTELGTVPGQPDVTFKCGDVLKAPVILTPSYSKSCKPSILDIIDEQWMYDCLDVPEVPTLGPFDGGGGQSTVRIGFFGAFEGEGI